MRFDEITDVNVVADASAIRRGVVAAENGDAVALPERGLASDLDQVRGRLRGVPCTPFRISPRNVEVAQNTETHRAVLRNLGEGAFRVEFCLRVGVYRVTFESLR